MTTSSSPNKGQPEPVIDRWIRGLFLLALLVFFGALMLAFAALLQAPAGAPLSGALQSLFALESVQMWWYVTRAAGLTGYFLLWLSMAWGLAISNKILSPVLEGTFTYDFHEFLSLLGLGFVLLHVIVLYFDRFLPFNLIQTLIPFIDTYRPVWVGLGIIGFYLFLLVTVTFYMRKIIGPQAFRSIHTLSLLGYLGATLHGLFAGTDSALAMTKLMYAFTFLVIVFLTAYWLIVGRLSHAEREQAIARAGRSQAPGAAIQNERPVRRASRLWLLLCLAVAGCSARTTAASPTAAAAASAPDLFAADQITLGAPSCSGTPSPAQTEGPYYKAGSPEQSILWRDGMAGKKLFVAGYVFDPNCKPLVHTWMDFWQADASGAYDNQGYTLRGHLYTDSQGRYLLLTVFPGEYPGRTEHIHVKIQPPSGAILTTQIYFPNAPNNSADGIFDPKLLVKLEDRGAADLAIYNFIVQP